MKTQATRLLMALAVVGAMGSNANADTLTINGYTGYRSGSGGEFTITSGSASLSSAFSAYAAVPGAPAIHAPSGGLQTFCLEINEFITLPGTYDFSISSAAMAGGANVGAIGGNPDTLSVGAAWLYRQFVQGTLGGYDTTPGVGRAADARVLQEAIWMLEDEIFPAANAYVSMAIAAFGGTFLGASSSMYNTGSEILTAATYGIEVLNLFQNDVFKQDQIFWNGGGRSVPDGGVTFILLGTLMGGLALLRRKLV